MLKHRFVLQGLTVLRTTGACPLQTATTGRKFTVTFQSLYLGKAQSRVTAAHFLSMAAHHIMHFPLVWMQQKLMHHALHTWGCGLAIHLHTVHPVGWWKGTEEHINDFSRWQKKHSWFCMKIFKDTNLVCNSTPSYEKTDGDVLYTSLHRSSGAGPYMRLCHYQRYGKGDIHKALIPSLRSAFHAFYSN